MKVQRIRNPDLIKSYVTEPSMWYQLAEDGIDPEAYFINTDVAVALALLDDDDLHGFIIAQPMTMSIHTVQFVIPEYNTLTEDLGRLACKVLGQNVRKLVNLVPEPDKDTLAYAQRIGFQREGVAKASFMRMGTLLNQYYLGMSHAEG